MADPRGGSAAAAGEGRVARTSGRRARGGDILTVTDIVIIIVIGIILWSGSLLNIHILSSKNNRAIDLTPRSRWSAKMRHETTNILL